MKFCWSCGHKNEEDAMFCENCGENLNDGTDISQEIIPKIDQVSTVEKREQSNIPIQVIAPKGPMSKKKKNSLIASGIIIASLIGVYSYGNYYYSYEQQVVRLTKVFKTQSPSEWSKVMISSDPNYKVSTEGLKKLTDYYKDNQQKEKFSNLVNNLDNKGTNENFDFSIVNNGKKFGLFNNYSLEIKPVYLTVESQKGDATIEVDGKKYGDPKDKEVKVGPLTPGIYKVKGTLKDVSTESIVDLVRFENEEFDTNSHVKLDLHKSSFIVQSNIDEADVLIDNKKIATIKNGVAEVKDIVWHQGLSVQVKKNFDKQVMETDVRRIEADEFLADNYAKDSYTSEINLAFSDIKSKEDVESFLSSVYSDVSASTSDYTTFDTMEKNELSDYFVNGQDNTDYKDFLKFISDVRSSSEKTRVVGTPKVESVSMIGKDTYHVQYLIQYETMYKSYKTDNIKQVFRYKKGTLKYNTKEERFEINDLGGVENFEVVDNGGV